MAIQSATLQRMIDPVPAQGRPASPAPERADFVREIVAADLREGRREAVVTRFPPEPNGYLHIGHAKAICLNFGIAREFDGRCHLRFDDTNPAREEQEYIDAIQADVRWLGFDWGEHLHYASDYFEQLYAWAQDLVRQGKAYVDDLTADQIREHRGTLTEPGRPSPFRDRPAEESLDLFERMRLGEFQDGARVLRARIDMASPNINLRDPVLYRIIRASHPRTGDAWCIYPTYDFAHGQSDAIEGVTHSLCTLEFEIHRPLYDWLLDNLPVPGHPRQIEFARLNLTHTVMSKRVLHTLVAEGHVHGWDDPRMPTLVGARRRGFTPEGFRLFAERIGVSKSDQRIDPSVLEDCMRELLNESADRRVAVLDPVRLVLDNYPADATEDCAVPNHPQKPERGTRTMPFARELWIEREDFTETPAKGYFRLFPGNRVRLRYAYVIECTGCDKDADGRVVAVRARYLPETRSGTPGADSVKVKGNIHWVSAARGVPTEVRLYDRLFLAPQPGAEGDYIADLNPASKRVVRACVETAAGAAAAGARFQFERHGYFIADVVDSKPGAPVFNRTVTLRDPWGQQGRK